MYQAGGEAANSPMRDAIAVGSLIAAYTEVGIPDKSSETPDVGAKAADSREATADSICAGTELLCVSGLVKIQVGDCLTIGKHFEKLLTYTARTSTRSVTAEQANNDPMVMIVCASRMSNETSVM